MEEKQALRQLPEIQNIAEYLRGMQFRKKLFGGVDAENVLEHFSAVTLQYEAIISAFMQQTEMYSRQLAEAQARLHGKEEKAMFTQPSRPWQGAAAAYPQAQPVPLQPMPQQAQPQQAFAAQNYNPWAPPAPQPYAPQPYAPQSYAPQPYGQQPYAPQTYTPHAAANTWQDGTEGPPESAGMYA